jgi:hypothetical protein
MSVPGERESSAGTPAMSSTPPPPSSPTIVSVPSGGGLGGGWIAIAVVALAVAIILGLVLAGLIPGLHLNLGGKGSSGGTGTGPSYSITFGESGLPTGTTWSVTLASTVRSSSASSVAFTEPNGSYAFTVGAVPGYSGSPATGSVVVSGAPVTKTVAFTASGPGRAPTYAVTFTESGLTAGTSWSVTLNGSSNSSSSDTIGFAEVNGSYAFQVGSVSGYTASPSSGTLTVNGAAAAEGITFTRNGGGGGNPISYKTALPLAQGAANGVPPGAWVPMLAGGVDLLAEYSNSSRPGTNSSCTVTNATSWPTIPAYTGDYSNGLLSWWVFGFYHSSTHTVLLVYVQAQTATVLGEISGTNCTGSFAYLSGLGSGIIDSTDAAHAIASADANYVSANPTASAFFVVFSGVTFGNYSISPEWSVSFTTCAPTGGSTGNNFTATVNATSGAVLSTNETTGEPCGSTPYLPALPLGPGPVPNVAGPAIAVAAVRE